MNSLLSSSPLPVCVNLSLTTNFFHDYLKGMCHQHCVLSVSSQYLPWHTEEHVVTFLPQWQITLPLLTL